MNKKIWETTTWAEWEMTNDQIPMKIIAQVFWIVKLFGGLV